MDSAGRVYVGTAYANQPIVAFVTYPQAGDHEKYISIGRPKLSQYDPWMGRKNDLASTVRDHAAELANANFGPAFADCNLDGPEDGDFDIFDRIVEDIIEFEIYRADGETRLTWGDPGDRGLRDEYVDKYVTYYAEREVIDPQTDGGRGNLLVSMVVDILADALSEDEDV